MLASDEDRECVLSHLEDESKSERESPLPVEDINILMVNFGERQGEGSPLKLR